MQPSISGGTGTTAVDTNVTAGQVYYYRATAVSGTSESIFSNEAVASIPNCTVFVAPGDNLQALVSANPSGTGFCITAGVHRDSVTTLKTGDSFIGYPGSTENGSVTLTGWTDVVISGTHYWTTPGGSPVSTTYDSTHCQAAHPACYLPQDLYVDNVTYTRQLTFPSASGNWYYDLDGGDGGVVNNVYLVAGENPNSHTVELGSLSILFKSISATNITIQGLTWEKYAGDIDHAPVSVCNIGAPVCTATGWLIQNNEARLNRMAGIIVHGGNGSGTTNQVLNNNVHHNGQSGIEGGNLIDSTFRNNELYSNNTDFVSPGYGAGGYKTGNSVRSTITGNTVYSNAGVGLWTDVYGTGDVYDNNASYNNDCEGIRYEISDHGTITNNLVYGNGSGSLCIGLRNQIAYASSSNGTIRNNDIVTGTNMSGISIQYTSSRGGCGTGCTVPAGMVVSNNRVSITNSGDLAAEAVSSGGDPTTWQSGVYNTNCYRVAFVPWSNANWRSGITNGPRSNFANWQAAGEDVAGSVSTSCSDARLSIVSISGNATVTGATRVH